MTLQTHGDDTSNRVTRWKRVLLALGEDVPGFTGDPTTAWRSQPAARSSGCIRSAMTAAESTARLPTRGAARRASTPPETLTGL